MSENRNETVKTSTPEPTTPTTINKETRNTCRGNRKGNLRHGNEGGASWSEQKDFKEKTTKLNSVLGPVTKILDQGVTFEKF